MLNQAARFFVFRCIVGLLYFWSVSVCAQDSSTQKNSPADNTIAVTTPVINDPVFFLLQSDQEWRRTQKKQTHTSVHPSHDFEKNEPEHENDDVAPVTPLNISPTITPAAPTPMPIPAPAPHQDTTYHVDAILFQNENSWSVWVNGRVFNNRSCVIGGTAQNITQVRAVDAHTLELSHQGELILVFVGQTYNVGTRALSNSTYDEPTPGEN